LIGRSRTSIVALMLSVAVGTASAQSTSRPPQSPPGDAAIPIFLQPPMSIDAFLARMQDPDFVLISGQHYRALKEKEGKAGPVLLEPRLVKLDIGGRVDRRTSELEVEYRIASVSPGSAWFPLRLDGIALTSVREGDRVLAHRTAGGGGWEVEVSGPGEHVVRVACVCPVAVNGEERRLDFPIPLSASTHLRLSFAEDATDCSLGTTEPVAISKDRGRAGTSLNVSIRPRSRIDLTWNVIDEPSAALSPLLIAQSGVVVDVSPDVIETRARFNVSSARGTSRALTFTFDADEELTRVDLDSDRDIPVASVTKGAMATVTVPLPEPLRQGGPSHSVVLVTRRKIAPQSTPGIALKGYALGDAAVQSGALAVTQTGPIWVEGRVGRGLQRIDPANELPADLRSHPGTVLAYRIDDQPFELVLQVKAAPPRLDARVRTALLIRKALCTTESQVDFRTTPGRVFGVRFQIPGDLKLDPLPPDDVVASSNVSRATGGGQVLDVRLSLKAREKGMFSIRLVARQAWEPRGVREIGLIQPLDTSSLGGRVAILRASGIEAALDEGGVSVDRPRRFEPDVAPSASDLSWLGRRNEFDAPPLWFDFDGSHEAIPLRLETVPASYRSEVNLVALVDRTRIDYRQTVRLEMLHGRLDELELLVPPGVEGDWEIEGERTNARELIATGPGGSQRYRIGLEGGSASKTQFVLRYRTSFPTPLLGDGPHEGRFTLIGVTPSGNGPLRISYASSPGVRLSVDATGWKAELADPGADGPSAGSTVLVRSEEKASLPRFTADAEAVVALPPLVVSRAYLRTVRSSEEVRTTAFYRIEGTGTSVRLGLPEGSRWIQARLDGAEVSEVSALAGSSERRISLGARKDRLPATLQVEYASASASPSAWKAPTLEGAEVETTFWEAVVSDAHALLGVPSGWSDENRWNWEGYVWTRRPWLSRAELFEWVAGSGAAKDGGDDPLLVSRSNAHSYLFRRIDLAADARLPATIVGRSALVAVCSGFVAAVGIGLILLRPRPRAASLCLLGVLAIAAAAFEPNLTIQAVQSGLLGVVLALIAATMQWIVERRRVAGGVGYAETIGSTALTAQPLQEGVAGSSVGSDDSTAIRPRPDADSNGIVVALPSAVSSVSETGFLP
jgi:hypothetical protein